MKNKKRFASLLLALCMILTLMPVGYANAEQDVPPFEVYYVAENEAPVTNLPVDEEKAYENDECIAFHYTNYYNNYNANGNSSYCLNIICF